MDVRLINVALGKEPADIIIRNGKLVNVLTREIYPTEIAIAGDKIASIGPLPAGTQGPNTKIIDAQGQFLAPGFLDAHIHVESSMLTYTEFAKAVVRHGTTAVVSDLMEVTIVSGVPGMKEVMAEAKRSPVKLYYTVPSFMEEGPQTTGAVLGPELMDELIRPPEAVGLAEVMCPPILAGSPESAHILDMAKTHHKTAEGHAPAVLDEKANAYASAGINSDHESTFKEEALGKLRCGLRILMREGSAATDLKACLKMVTENHVDTRRCCMVSDDIDALHIARCGHLDYKIRMAIGEGIDPVTAIQMVTINPAESFRLDDKIGSITPGKQADIVFLKDLCSLEITRVMSDGKIVVEGGKLAFEMPAPVYSEAVINTVRLLKPVTGGDLVIRVPENTKSAKVRVIGASPVSLLTEALEAEVPAKDGVLLPDIGNDVLRIACVERYGKNGSIGKAFIRNFGLKEGALAISVGHDHHNITVVGCDADDMALAVNRVAELQGGFVLVNRGKVLEEIALPVCGLLSTESGDAVADKLQKMLELLAGLGCTMPSPNVTLSFIPLIFIPFLAITDQGLFDVIQFKIVDPVISLN